MIYALDTNIIIHYLKKTPKLLQNFNTAVMRNSNFVIPKMVDYEIRRGFSVYPAPAKEAVYDALTHQGFCDIGEMDIASWDRAIEVYSGLYAKRFTVNEMDILIAATCIENGYTLITNNVDDFKNMDNLIFEDWVKDDIKN